VTNELTPVTDHWTADKRVPLALIAAIVFQAVALASAGAWFMSDLSNKIEQNSRDIVRQGDRVFTVERNQNAAFTTAARLEERIDSINNSIRRIENLIEKALERREVR
jgi:TolA-binding protein